MAWTYDPSFPELSNDVQKDSSTPGRFTFERKMYFKPDSYDNWANGTPYVNTNYSAQLATHPSIPKLKSACPNLPDFYLADIVDISNLNEDDDGEAVSYGVVTLLYENKKPKPQGTTNSDGTENKPWKREVDDFTITNQEISVPFVEGYVGNDLMPVMTTAYQPIYDFTTSKWIQRCTWTFCDQGTNYFISSPIINQSQETLFSKIKIDAGTGLLLPPSYRKLFYVDEDGNETSYDEWQFEVIVDPAGQFIPVINAGTKALGSDGQFDICTWCVADLQGGSFAHYYGTFLEMMQAKAAVDAANAENEDPLTQQVFTGDFAQSPIPLTEGGEINNSGLNIIMPYEQYPRGNWKLGIR